MTVHRLAYRPIPGDEVRLWDHQPEDRYLVIIAYPWVNDGEGVDFHSDLVLTSFGHAVLNGARLAKSDDFNIGVVRDGRLVALLWIDQILTDQPTTLLVIENEIGLSA